jgi:hypothetical protein
MNDARVPRLCATTADATRIARDADRAPPLLGARANSRRSCAGAAVDFKTKEDQCPRVNSAST